MYFKFFNVFLKWLGFFFLLAFLPEEFIYSSPTRNAIGSLILGVPLAVIATFVSKWVADWKVKRFPTATQVSSTTKAGTNTHHRTTYLISLVVGIITFTYSHSIFLTIGAVLVVLGAAGVAGVFPGKWYLYILLILCGPLMFMIEVSRTTFGF